MATEVGDNISITSLSEEQAMRYCNWIENGALKDDRSVAMTESGIYDLTGEEIVVNEESEHHVVIDILYPGCFFILTNRSNNESALTSQVNSPLMMSGMGKQGKQPREKTGYHDAHKINSEDPSRQNQDSSETVCGSATREVFTQGHGIAERNPVLDQQNHSDLIGLNRDKTTTDRLLAALEAHSKAERFIISTHQNEIHSIKPSVIDLNTFDSTQGNFFLTTLPNKLQSKVKDQSIIAYRNVSSQIETETTGTNTLALLKSSLTNSQKEFEENANNNLEAIEAHRKRAQAFDQQAEALRRGDTASASLYDQVAHSYRSAGWRYRDTDLEEANNNLDASKGHLNSARFSERQAEALIRGDTALALRYGKLAKIYFGVALGYENAAMEKIDNRLEASEVHLNIAYACELQAEALIIGNTALALHYETVEQNYNYAVLNYGRAAIEKANNNLEAAEAHRQRALFYKQQAEGNRGLQISNIDGVR